MKLGSQIRKLLHGYGIHSATIQPEFIEDRLDEKANYDEDTHSESNLIIHGREQVPNSPSENSIVSLNEVQKKKRIINLQNKFLLINLSNRNCKIIHRHVCYAVWKILV